MPHSAFLIPPNPCPLLLAPAAAHPGSRVKSFAVCGDLRYAAMALFDSTVTVWDLHTSEPVAVLQRWGERDSATGHSSGAGASGLGERARKS